MLENEELGQSLHMHSIEAIQTVRSSRMDGTNYAQLFENGIAVISLYGPIFPRANMMTMSGATSISQFVNDIIKVEAHSDVRGIVLDVDSPGGDVRGIGDAAKMINMVARQSKKPIQAFASGFMASAAYYVSSAVGPGNIIASESAMIGSIGVVLNARKNDANEIEIVSSISPNKHPDISSQDGRAILQQRVDDLADIFSKDVSKYRKVSLAKVLADYGQGDAPVAPRALKQGLVDRIGTLSQVVEEMAAGTTSRRSSTRASESVESLLEFNEDDNIMSLKSIAARFRASTESLVEDNESNNTTPAAVTDAELEAAGTEEPIVEEEAVDTVPPAAAQGQIPTYADLEERFSDSAELFATQMVTASKLYPALSVYAASEFMNARIDDNRYGGSVKFVDAQGQITEGTREAAVRAKYDAMPKHTMTQQAIKGIKDGTVKASVLGEADVEEKKEGPMTPERKTQLLASSVSGQAVLKAQAQQS